MPLNKGLENKARKLKDLRIKALNKGLVNKVIKQGT